MRSVHCAGAADARAEAASCGARPAQRLAMSPAAGAKVTDGQDRLAEGMASKKGQDGRGEAARLRAAGERGLAALRRGTGDAFREEVTGEMVSAFTALAVCGLRGCHWPDLRLIHDQRIEASSCLGCRVMIVLKKQDWMDGGFAWSWSRDGATRNPRPTAKSSKPGCKKEKTQQNQGSGKYSQTAIAAWSLGSISNCGK